MTNQNAYRPIIKSRQFKRTIPLYKCITKVTFPKDITKSTPEHKLTIRAIIEHGERH